MRYLLILLSFIAVFVVQAQYPAYRHIGEEEGLPSGEVYSISKDNIGFVWLGTGSGLYRYNGTKFVRYANKSQASFPVAGLRASRNGEMYGYSFANQLLVWRNDSLHIIDSWNGKRVNGFPSIDVTTDGKLWVSSDKGLYSYLASRKQWTLFNDFDGDGVRDNDLWVGRLTAKGNKLWYLTQGSVGCIQNGKSSLYPVLFQPMHTQIVTNYLVCADSVAVWLVGVSGGVYRKAGNYFVPYKDQQLDALLAKRKVTCAGFTNGLLYLLTYSGVIVYNTETHSSSLLYEQESFADYLIDKDGTMWLCTINNGIYMVADDEIITWNKSMSGMREERIGHVAQHKGRVCFSQQNGDISTIDVDGRCRNIYKDNGVDVGALFYDMDGKLIFNCNNSLYRLEGSSAIEIRSDVGPVKDIIAAGDKYVVATSLGTKVYDRNWKMEYVISLTWARSLAYDSATALLYIATNSGIEYSKLQGGDFKQSSVTLPATQILGVCNKPGRGIYAISYKGELYDIDGEANTLLAKLPHKVPVRTIRCAGNFIYTATTNGLFVYNVITARWQWLNGNDGLAGRDVYHIAIADSLLWLATSKGVQHIPLYYAPQVNKPRVVLSKIKAGNTLTKQLAGLQLNYKDGITLYPEGVNYSALQGSVFAYRILTSNSNWTIVPFDAEEIFIPTLPSGNFIVELKVVDDKGRNSLNTITVSGYVKPPFWQRWWFYILLTLFVLAIAYSVFRSRVNLLRHKQQLKLQRMQLENEVNLSQQAALTAQMNPHFIFNVLNSIKGYIYENDRQSAAEYLGKFAQLIRKILEASSRDNVRLGDEIEALELYIQLEAMQLPAPFSYSINIDSDVDVNAVCIPSLIIQPFVENAFKHGLRYKQGDKCLIVSIQMYKPDVLMVTIADNGVGIGHVATGAISAGQTHKPFATQASAKRLQLINKRNADAVHITFADRPEGGTTVSMYIQV